MKKLLIFILAIAMSITVFACAGGNDNNGGNTPPPQSNTGDGTGTSESSKTVPDTTYDARDFYISMSSGMNYEFYQAEESTDPIKSALYYRNLTVEDLADIVIVPVYAEAGADLYAHADEIITSYYTEEAIYDITATMVVASGRLITNNVLVDWNAQKYNDLDASWWLNGANDAFSIFGSVYTAVGKTNISALRMTYALMYNKTMGDGIDGLTDRIYNAIDNKTWTIDELISITSNIYMDDDQDPNRSAGDIYGFVAENQTNLDAYSQAFGLNILAPSESDGLEFVYRSDRLVTAVDKIIQLYHENTGSFIFTEAGGEGNSFNHGKALFATMRIETAIGGGLEIMEDVYTILPYPMLDEEQGEYYSGIMDNYTVMGIYALAPDYDFCSHITELLNMEAETQLYPKYYDEALCKKYVTDERYVEMVDIVLGGRRFEAGTLFQDQLYRISMLFRDVVAANNGNTILNFIDGREQNIKDQVAEIVAQYLEKQQG